MTRPAIPPAVTDPAPASAAARARIALALDVDDEVAALRLAARVRPSVGIAKVGLELYCAAGPTVVGALQEMGYEVFCDLKLYDIPTTVRKAARVVGSLGARWLNAPAAAGAPALEAMVEGFLQGAEAAGTTDPVPLAVTVLTSESTDDGAVLRDRIRLAVAAGCRGVVCAATDLPTVAELGPALTTVVPGIRPEGVDAHDQVRTATPATAIGAGAGVLVVGRAITAAADPVAAAAAIAAEVDRALDGSVAQA